MWGKNDHLKQLRFCSIIFLSIFGCAEEELDDAQTNNTNVTLEGCAESEHLCSDGSRVPVMLDCSYTCPDENMMPEDPPDLCIDTGGQYGEACEFKCGTDIGVCLEPQEVCLCSPGRRFDATNGCVDDPDCGSATTADANRCRETGGTWWYDACDNFNCGSPATCDENAPHVGACQCEFDQNFNSQQGCISDVSCDSEVLEGCREDNDCPLGQQCDLGFTGMPPGICY